VRDRVGTPPSTGTEQRPLRRATRADHGRRSHVLMTVEDFDRLTAGKELLGDRLWRGQDPDIELPLPERGLEPPRGLDL